MLITLTEILHMVLMTGLVGYILMDYFSEPITDPLRFRSGFDWDAFRTAVLVTAPALILHELGHKFVALGFGLSATFQAAFFWLGLGVLLKLMGSKFLFFVPAYVAVMGPTSHPESILIAFAGPFVNLIIAGIAELVLKFGKLTPKTKKIWYLTRQINFFLFVLNMLPLPFFDGGKVFGGIWALLSSLL